MAKKQEYIYFWKPSENPYGGFSNWSNHSYQDTSGKTISNSEIGLMLAKLELFDSSNSKLRHLILESTNPAFTKKLGRQIKNFNQTIWDQKKFQIMVDILILKFSQNQDLKILLLSTNDSFIVEASPYDNIWGIGLNKFDAMKIKMDDWPGENLLGKALMQVREILRI
jgi:ribA/ribD-fused uncharacterized protein